MTLQDQQESSDGWQEALSRVEAAQRAGATSLDLSRLHLEVVPEGALMLPQLTHLDLAANRLGPDAAQVLADAIESGWLSNLSRLNLDSNDLGPEGFRPLAKAIKARGLPCLSEFILSANGIGPNGGTALLSAIRAGGLPQLTQLSLWHNELGAAFGMSLAAEIRAGRLSRLLVLDLESNRLGPESGIEIARALCAGGLPRLTRLVLSRNNLDAAFGAAMTEALRAGKLALLTGLLLSENLVGTAFLESLACAIVAGELPLLEYVALNDCDHGLWEEDGPEDPQQAARLILDASKGQLDLTIKVPILGEPSAGKTGLRCRLTGRQPPMAEDRPAEETHSFTLGRLTVKAHADPTTAHDELESEGVVDLRLFDFGGQRALQGTHRFFLGRERTMYCVVVNAAIQVEDSRIEYWLRYVADIHEQRLLWQVHAERERGARKRLLHEEVPHHLATDQTLAAWVEEQRTRRPRPVCVAVLTRCTSNDHSFRDPKRRPPLKRVATPERLLEIAKQVDGVTVRLVDGYDSFDPRWESRLQEVLAGLADAAGMVTEIWRDKRPRAFFLARERIETRFGFGFADDDNKPGEPWMTLEDAKSLIARAIADARGDAAHAAEDTPKYLRDLRDLGVVHWVGDWPESAVGRDSRLREMVFNPRWLRGPVCRVLRMSTPSATKEVSRENLLAELMGELERTGPKDRSPGITLQQATHLLALMQASELVVPLEDVGSSADDLLVLDHLDTYDELPTGSDVTWRIGFLPDWFMPRLIGKLWSLRGRPRMAYRNYMRLRLDDNTDGRGAGCDGELFCDHVGHSLHLALSRSSPRLSQQVLISRVDAAVEAVRGRRVPYDLHEDVARPMPSQIAIAPVLRSELSMLSRRQLDAFTEWAKRRTRQLNAPLGLRHEDGMANLEHFLRRADAAGLGALERSAAVPYQAWRLFKHEFPPAVEQGQVIAEVARWLLDEAASLGASGPSFLSAVIAPDDASLDRKFPLPSLVAWTGRHSPLAVWASLLDNFASGEVQRGAQKALSDAIGRVDKKGVFGD